MSKIQFVSALLGGMILVACNGHPCLDPDNASLDVCQEQDTDTDTDSDSDTDSDTDADGEATIVATVIWPDGTEATDAEVSVERGPADVADVVAEAWSGDEMIVPAPASYRVLAGDRGNKTQEDLPLPLVTDESGWEWVSPVYEADVTDEGLTVATRPLHKYYWGLVVCDICVGDGCIAEGDYYSNEEGTYGVEEGYLLKLEATLGYFSWLEFTDDGNLSLKGDLAEDGFVVVTGATIMDENTIFFQIDDGGGAFEQLVTFE
ncbi:MAG: hypothetical protein WC730_01590 [Patescibacteria group bacterium]|jgi:hypothetical protein